MNIYEFEDYRAFLNNYLNSLPRSGRGERSRFASKLRTNTTLISQVLSGKRDFTLEQAFMLTNYLGLDFEATEYFIALVLRERSGLNELKQHLTNRIQASRSRNHHQNTTAVITEAEL